MIRWQTITNQYNYVDGNVSVKESNKTTTSFIIPSLYSHTVETKKEHCSAFDGQITTFTKSQESRGILPELSGSTKTRSFRESVRGDMKDKNLPVLFLPTLEQMPSAEEQTWESYKCMAVNAATGTALGLLAATMGQVGLSLLGIALGSGGLTGAVTGAVQYSDIGDSEEMRGFASECNELIAAMNENRSGPAVKEKLRWITALADNDQKQRLLEQIVRAAEAPPKKKEDFIAARTKPAEGPRIRRGNVNPPPAYEPSYQPQYRKYTPPNTYHGGGSTAGVSFSMASWGGR